MQHSNYPGATLQLPCNFIPACFPFSPWRCNCLAPYHRQLQHSNVVRCRRDWRRADEPHYFVPRRYRTVNVVTWVFRFCSRRRWTPISSSLPTRFFFLTASSWRLGHLLSEIFVSLIFAPLPDHSSIAILRERVLLPCKRRHFAVTRSWE